MLWSFNIEIKIGIGEVQCFIRFQNWKAAGKEHHSIYDVE